MVSRLHSWKMPKVPGNQIYGRKGCFSVVYDGSMFSFEGSVPLKKRSVNLELLGEHAFSKAFNQKVSRKQKKRLKTCYLHVGLIQVGVKPLARQVANEKIVFCLRDTRFLDLKTSLLGLVESDLTEGPVYFDSFANITIPLSVPNLASVLTVNVTSKFKDKTTQGLEPFLLTYRVCCKIMSRPHGENALQESPSGSTLMYQAELKSNAIASRSIKWDEIEIPECWLQQVEQQKAELQGQKAELQKAAERDAPMPRQRLNLFERKANMESRLHSWKMPRVPVKQVYRQKGCFGGLSYASKSIITFEGSVPVENGNVTLKLLTGHAFEEAFYHKLSTEQMKKLEFSLLHLGLVQVGVKPLAREVANEKIVFCLRDDRYRNLKPSLMGLAEANLTDGPVYFNYFPNCPIDFSDPSRDGILTVNVTSKCKDKTTTQEVEPLLLTYRVCCTIRGDGAKALQTSPSGSTLMYQAKLRSNKWVATSKLIKWDDIEIPESWFQ